MRLFVACAILGSGCAGSQLINKFPNQVRKGRVVIVGSSAAGTALLLPVYQDVAGRREKLGELASIDSNGLYIQGGFGSVLNAPICLLATAPADETTIYVGSGEATVEIRDGMTTPINVVTGSINPVGILGLGGRRVDISFKVGKPFANQDESECPYWLVPNHPQPKIFGRH
jgi:hypothetical protein